MLRLVGTKSVSQSVKSHVVNRHFSISAVENKQQMSAKRKKEKNIAEIDTDWLIAMMPIFLRISREAVLLDCDLIHLYL